MNLRTKTNRPEVNTVWKSFFSNTRPLLLALPILISASAYAGSNKLVIPVALSFPTSSEAIEKSLMRFGNERLQTGFSLSQNLNDVTISDPFALRLSGVKLTGHLSGRLDRDQKGLIVEASLQNFEISIERISIHTVVKARVAGVDASIRIDAECTGSSIRWPNEKISFFTRGRLATAPLLSLDMSGLALPADLTKPEMKLSCQGPFGMEDLIRDYAWTAIQMRWTDRLFAEEIETKIEESFASMLAVGGTGLNLIDQPGLLATLIPEKYDRQTEGAHLGARLELHLDRPVSVQTTLGSNLELPKGRVEDVTLSVPASAAEAVMQVWLAPSVWSEWIEGKSIEGFRDLMSSRFKQIIAFPDLQNYPKSASFWFALEMIDRPKLQCAKGALALQAPVGAWMLLQDANLAFGYKPMVRFSIPTNLSIGLPQIKTNKRISANVESMGLSYEFDARYVREERPNTIIASEQIRDGIADFVESKTSQISSFEGFVGETAKALNQTNVVCESSTQVIRIALPTGL